MEEESVELDTPTDVDAEQDEANEEEDLATDVEEEEDYVEDEEEEVKEEEEADPKVEDITTGNEVKEGSAEEEEEEEMPEEELEEEGVEEDAVDLGETPEVADDVIELDSVLKEVDETENSDGSSWWTAGLLTLLAALIVYMGLKMKRKNQVDEPRDVYARFIDSEIKN